MIKGVPIRTVVRIRSSTGGGSGNLENIKVMGSTIALIGKDNQSVEEFDCGDIYNEDFTMQQIFEMSIVP